MTETGRQFIYGIHPVREALKASKRKCYKIVVAEGKTNPRIRSVLDLARTQKVKVEVLPRLVFQKKYRDCLHQGVVGYFSVKPVLELEELIQQAFEATSRPTLVILDGIQDPHNLGAIIRSAETLGIQGLILPTRRTAALNETVAKCSAGAIENLPVAWVPNLTKAIPALKKADFWIVGVDVQGQTPCNEFKFDLPVTLVIGGEEKGIRPLLKKNCDFTLSIPMEGKTGSLNAAAASSVIFYEILRQKREREVEGTKGEGVKENTARNQNF